MIQQNETPTPEKRSIGSKKKIFSILFIVLLLLGSFWFQSVAYQIQQEANESLLAQANAAINGQIVAAAIDLTILGVIEAKNVQILNAAGEQLATIERIQLHYNWLDLLNRQLGPHLITSVTIERPEIWLTYAQESLNWSGLLKPKTVEESQFAALVEIRDGTAHIKTNFFNKTVEQLHGQLDFHQSDLCELSVAGLADQANFLLSGHWGTLDKAKLSIAARNLDLNTLGLTSSDDSIKITEGCLDELLIQLGKKTDGAIELQQLSGSFSNVSLTGSVNLTQCRASFAKQGNRIYFQDIHTLYHEQPVTATGSLSTIPNEKELVFTLQMPAGDPAALLPSLNVSGPFAMQASLSGSALAPVLTGDFTLGGLRCGNAIINNINASFSYTGQQLRLHSAYGNTTGGFLAASGTVGMDDTKALDLAIYMPDGNPAAFLPSLTASGPLVIDAALTGSTAAPLLTGEFSLASLLLSDISVQNIYGSFSYAGQMLHLQSTHGSTTGGSISASGPVDTTAESYSLSLLGSGLDSSRLTTKDVSGPLSMWGTAYGQGNSATTQGRFSIQNGKAYGIAFRTLSGDFIKEGSAEAQVSNLTLHTDWGTFYPDQLNQEILEQLRKSNFPTSEEAFKEEVTEKVKKAITDKLREELFR